MLSTPQLIAQANAICKEVSAKIENPKSKRPGLGEIERLAGVNVISERAALDKLRELRPPKSLEGGWKQVLGDRQTLIDELVELSNDARRNDQKGINQLSLTKQIAHSTLANDASRLHVKECAVVG